jgi:hypothetical protein
LSNSIKHRLSTIDAKDVKRLCSDKVYKKGVTYFKEGRNSKQIIHGNLLSGDVEGNEVPIYHVKIRYENGTIFSNCTCPYEFEELCKHSVSLLLNWIYKREQFTDVDLFLEDIKEKSKEEVLIIIKRWIYLYPTILLDYSEHDLKVFDNKMEKLFSSNEQFYHNPGKLLEELEGFNEVLKEYKIKSDIESFDIIKSNTEKCIKNYSKVRYYDEGGVFIHLVEQLLETYSEMLRKMDPEWSIKENIHKDNLKMFLKDENFFSDFIARIIVNSCNTSNDLIFMENAILKEIESRSKNKKEQEHGYDEYYTISKIIHLLLDLYEKNKDYGKFIQICEKELKYCYFRYIEYLESSGKIENAIIYCNTALDYAKGLEQVDLFTKLGDLEVKQENKEKALSYYMNAFGIKSQDQEELLEKIRKISRSLNKWENIKEDIVLKLEKTKQYYELIEIYLKDSDFDMAYKVASQNDNCDIYIKEKVAKALKKRFPERAADLYKIIGERFLNRPNRESYRTALHYFKEIKKIYYSLGYQTEFKSYVDILRSKNIKKRLLQRELSKLDDRL